MNKRKQPWGTLPSRFYMRIGLLCWSVLTMPVMAQVDIAGPQNQSASKKEDPFLAPVKMDVQPVAHDEDIRKRLQSVLEAVQDGRLDRSGRSHRLYPTIERPHHGPDIKIYFWLNGHDHSWLKVRSSVIRLVKRAFQQHGISVLEEAREVVFP